MVHWTVICARADVITIFAMISARTPGSAAMIVFHSGKSIEPMRKPALSMVLATLMVSLPTSIISRSFVLDHLRMFA